MKTLFHLFPLLLLSVSVCWAQQIDLQGQVYILNSLYQTGQIKYVEGAAIQAAFAGETRSDADGQFGLTFSGLENGSLVDLTVEKAGLEVVNERDVLNVVLGRKQPLKIFLAPQGELAQRQTELYEVSLAALTAKQDALIASLRAGGVESTRTIEELEQQLNRELEHRYEAENIIREQLEATKERLPEMVKRLAEVNLDFASAIYRSAYEAYLAGDISRALDLLDEEQLSATADVIVAALSGIQEGQQDFQLAVEAELEKASQVYESYALKADAYELIFDYQNAAEVRQKGVALLEAVKEGEDLELADAYGALALVLERSGQYYDALETQLKATSIFEDLLSFDDSSLIAAYSGLAGIHQALGDFDEALEYENQVNVLLGYSAEPTSPLNQVVSFANLASIYQDLGYSEYAAEVQMQAISLLLATLKEFPSELTEALDLELQLADCFNNLATILSDLGEYEQALMVQEKDIALKQQYLKSDDLRLATSYHNLSGIQYERGNYQDALVAGLNSLQLRERYLEPSHPLIAQSHSHLSLVYLKENKIDEALASQEKAVRISEAIFKSDHINLADVYYSSAIVLQGVDKIEEAIAMQLKGLAIKEKKLAAYHPELAKIYSNLGLLYVDYGDYEKSLVYQRQTISINELVLDPQHPDLGIGYHNLVASYLHLNQLDTALIYQRKAHEITNQQFPTTHPIHEIIRRNFAIMYPLRAAELRTAKAFATAIEHYQAALPFTDEPEAIHAEIGQTYVLQGELVTALDQLEKAIQLGYDNWEWLRTETALDPLRDHPRFQALLAQAPAKND